MSNKKFTCGSMWPSGCVLFTGELPDFVDADSFECDGNMDELLEKYGAKIDEIAHSIDLSTLNVPNCLTFNTSTGTVKDFAQEIADRFCALNTTVIALQNAFNALDIGSKTIEIDLGDLTPVGDPCAVADNTYTLISILNLFKSEIISLKEQII